MWKLHTFRVIKISLGKFLKHLVQEAKNGNQTHFPVSISIWKSAFEWDVEMKTSLAPAWHAEDKYKYKGQNLRGAVHFTLNADSSCVEMDSPDPVFLKVYLEETEGSWGVRTIRGWGEEVKLVNSAGRNC